jgi:hypothetical protein
MSRKRKAPEQKIPLPSTGGSFELVDGKLVERSTPTAPPIGKTERAQLEADARGDADGASS